MAQEQQQRFIQLGTMPVNKLVLKMSAPTMVAMLATAIYNMADTYFVSNLGKSQSGAVGIVFPLMSIIQAMGMTFGAGGASYISRLLGEKNLKEANRTVSTSFFTSICAAVVFAVVCSLFVTPMMRAFGATETILPYAVEYARWILLGTPFIAATFVLNQSLRAEGNAMLGMIGIMAGGLLNVVLDPIFIYTLDLGVAGAAIATVISQCVGCLILLTHYVRKRTSLRLSIREFTFSAGIYKEIFKIGIPTFLRQSLGSIYTIFLNNAASPYGDSVIAGMNLATRISFVVFSLLLGFCQGYQPVAGYNFGAQNHHRLREAFWFSMKVVLLVMVVCAAIVIIFAPQLIGVFLNEPDVVEVGARLLRLVGIFYPLMGLATVVNFTYQALGRGIASTVLSTCRQGWAALPILFIMTRFNALDMILWATPLADLVFGVTGIILGVKTAKEIKAWCERRSEDSQEGALLEHDAE